MKRIKIILLSILIPIAAFGAVINGDTVHYSVSQGDSLQLISAKVGVNIRAIALMNHFKLKPVQRLIPGQDLLINTRKIVPKTLDNGIIIDVSAKMLYFFKNSKIELSFPVGLGMPEWRGDKRWHTPIGSFTIARKSRNPVWYVPQSIQEQLRLEGKPILTEVQPGPDNPLGTYILYTSFPEIAIHETTSPTSVYQFWSHGCIRVLPQNIKKLYDEVDIGTPGESVYEPVKAMVTDEGRVLLEVDPDVYDHTSNLLKEATDYINMLNVAAEVCWDDVRRVVQERSGVAEDISLLPLCALNR
jgi:L,D-transpeptidase ErfK/SrfK